jgi:hypothetical protein
MYLIGTQTLPDGSRLPPLPGAVLFYCHPRGGGDLLANSAASSITPSPRGSAPNTLLYVMAVPGQARNDVRPAI